MEKVLARSIIYDFLAKGILYPDEATYNTFIDTEFVENLKGAVRLLQEEGELSIEEKIDEGINNLKELTLEGVLTEYERLFGICSRNIQVVLHQTEIVLKKGKTFYLAQSHDLADLAGFYKAFGFEVDKIRVDNFGVELEFMYVLTFKEFQAIKDGEKEKQEICADAEKKFLLNYLGAAGPVFARGIKEATESGYFKLLAETFSWFIEREISLFNIVLTQNEEPPPASASMADEDIDEEIPHECTTCKIEN